jgi:hypothetical protein
MFQKIVASGPIGSTLPPGRILAVSQVAAAPHEIKKGQAVQNQLLDKLEHGRIPMDKSSERLRF